MKKLVIIVAAIFIYIPVFCQFTAGTLKVSLNLGNSPYVTQLQAPVQTSNLQSLNAEGARWISGNSNSLINMIGMEFKFFAADQLAVKLIGGGQASFTPGQSDIPGVDDNVFPFDPLTAVPAFSEIKEQKLVQYLGQLGVDKYFAKRTSAIYVGVEGGFRYGASSTQSVSEDAAGASRSEVYGFQGAINFGAEYGSEEGLFAGVEIRPVSLAYTVSTIEPMSGVSQSADNITWGFFVYPMLRIGVNF